MRYYFEYSGGLGDVVASMMEQGSFNVLMEMGREDTAEVHLKCINPHARELFDCHPKSSQIKVFNHGWLNLKGHAQYKRELNDQWRQEHGLPTPRPEPHNPKSGCFDITYYPADVDKHIIEPFIGTKYVVISASASTDDRTFSQELIQRLIEECQKREHTPVFVGKYYTANLACVPGFSKKKSWDHIETLPDGNNAVSLIDKLTVPTTATLIQNSSGVVSCHSAVKIIALAVKKKTLLLYPERIRRWLETGKIYHKWVERHPLCTHTHFDNPDIQKFIDRFFGMLL